MTAPAGTKIARVCRFAAMSALASSIGLTGSCSSEPAADVPRRSCGLRVWHKPASADAQVEIVGDWDGFRRPGTVPDRAPDGWRVAVLSPPPGEHAYAIVEDGAWLIDRQVPMTGDHEGREVSVAVVPDCNVPALRVEGVDVQPNGRKAVRVTFLAAGTGGKLDPTSIDGGGLRVLSSDPATGEIVLEAPSAERGKYTYVVRARDDRNAAAEEARATVWNDGRSGDDTWDPRDAIIYQVLIDRFRGPNGAALASPASAAGRAGGTLSGVRAALDSGELEALGVDTLWLSPLYANPNGEFPGNDGRPYTSYHGYWPIASRALESRFTNEAELDAFMAAAHARGLRVLFDVVPNHVHEQHPYVQSHAEWFPRGCTCGQGACDWASNIKTCWFAPYLPDFDWTRADVAHAVTDDVLWWFDRFGADGIRIDAVPMMPRSATRRMATAVRTRYEHPGNTPYVLGENFTGPGGFGSLRYDLGPFGLDGSFHFPLMWTLRDAIAAEHAPMSDIEASFRAGEAAWSGAGAVMGLMLGNHDVSRFASVSAGNADGDAWSPPPQPVDPVVYAKQRVALAAVLTLPGAPVIYYGDEIGLAGRSDPDCRRVMPSETELLPAQVETRDVARKLGRTRGCLKALRRGALETLVAGEEAFVFARALAGDSEGAAIVALTRRPALPTAVRVPSGMPGALVDVVTGERVDASSGTLTVPADAFGVHVYVASGGECAPR